MDFETYKSGFVAIIGRPNVGKSTFLNNVIGKKVAIISDKPQTTRNKILGILTTDDYQIAFTDTPGIHKAKTELGRRMVSASYESTAGVDAVIFMTTPVKEPLQGDLIILSLILFVSTTSQSGFNSSAITSLQAPHGVHISLEFAVTHIATTSSLV